MGRVGKEEAMRGAGEEGMMERWGSKDHHLESFFYFLFFLHSAYCNLGGIMPND
jgi:hypothetical protein